MATTTETTTQIQSTITPVNDSSFIPRGSVDAKIHFYDPPADNSKPFNYVEKPPEGQPQRNFGDDVQSVTISDIRGQESSFDLSTHAFATLSNVPSKTTISTFHSETDDAVKETYYPEIENLLLKHVPGTPNRVLIFDHTIRRADPNAHRAPVTRAHIDQTTASAFARVRHHLPASEAEEVLKGRVRLINVWRPLNKSPVQSFPLGFADSTTVKDDQLVGIEHRYPDRTGETAAVKHQDERWYYWSGMDGGIEKKEGGERLMLQCFDSEGGARVPHTAFIDPRTPEGAEARESIEVRALVFG